MAPISENTTQPRQIPGLWNLFASFVLISLLGFGGTLAWARRMVVDERRWMNATEFNEVFSLCQFLPGPNVVNFAVVFGARVRGVPGAISASAGLVGPSLVLMVILGALYARYGEIESLRRVLGGIAPAAAGLIFGMTAKMAQPLFQSGRWHGPLLAAATLVAVGIFRVPLWWALAALLPIGILLGWRWPQ
jgi:chromate transporter